MKRLFAVLLAVALLACLFAGCAGDAGSEETAAATDATAETAASSEAPTGAPAVDYSGWHVALLTEEAEMPDLSCSRLTYEAAMAWCEARGVDFASYKPAETTAAALTESVEQAIADGYNVLLLPGWTILDTVKDTAGKHPDVRYVLLDVTSNRFARNYVMPDNVCSVVFPEEILGYLAGYAAVKLGCRHLFWLGTTKSAPTLRYGYGFVQGANDAAVELDVAREVAVEFVLANTQSADPVVTAYVEEMYQKKGIELCYPCAGVEGSVSEAAQKADGAKLIGADIDRSAALETVDGENVMVSAAVKNYAAAVQTALSDLMENGRWRSYGGKFVPMGIVSGEDLDANYVGLASTRFEDGKFTEEDYAALIAALFAGEIKVSDETADRPAVEIAVNYRGNIE